MTDEMRKCLEEEFVKCGNEYVAQWRELVSLVQRVKATAAFLKAHGMPVPTDGIEPWLIKALGLS